VAWLVAAAGIVAVACGGKTGLLKADSDAGAGDAGPGLTVDCGRSVQYTSPSRPITLEATFRSDAPMASAGWELLERPYGSSATISPTIGATTTLVPDQVGSHALRFTASDRAGNTASCEVTVESIVGPPAAMCPEDPISTPPNVPVRVEGGGYDDVAVVGYRWEIHQLANDAAIASLDPRDEPVTTFAADTPGRYQLQLTVFDGDGSSDACLADIEVAPPPVVTCPEGPLYVPTRQQAELTATADRGIGSLTYRWEVVQRPTNTSATPTPNNAGTTHFTPDRQGEYVLEFTAQDEYGQSASCDVLVVGTPTPPTVTCPAQVETVPLSATTVTATAVDDGTVIDYTWTLVDGPQGSAAGPPTETAANSVQFTPDIAGTYHVRVIAFDNDGQTGECTTTVLALATEGLRVELFWDSAPDMDLHLLSPQATYWFSNLDCYFGNCVGRNGLTWYSASAANPHLDLDDTTSYGPENINIDAPEPGVYRVGVHAWQGHSYSVNVRVYCGGSTTVPMAEFGPVELPYGYLWRVADVNITATGCSLTPLDINGGPNIDSDDPRNGGSPR